GNKKATINSLKPDSPLTARQRNQPCLGCHQDATRSAWHVGAHDANQLACTDCHKLHTDRDPVQAKSTQPDVCFTCHKKQRADFQKASTHPVDRKSTRLNSSHVEISYAVFCLKK